MFERFSDSARRVIVVAQEEARHLHHNHIGTEHVLLGLLAQDHDRDHDVAVAVLQSVGVELAAVRQVVVEIVGQGKQAPTGHIPFTPNAKRVLELSLREALDLEHEDIDTEHLLLGLLDVSDSVAGEALSHLGVDAAEVRERVRGAAPPGRGPSRLHVKPEYAERLARIESLLVEILDRLQAIEHRLDDGESGSSDFPAAGR
ncbi:MAG TPA: Clp protease N-terminal domain-containing protein [Nocardioidaceae bacterium]|nr:Clp protease N-terminal domain-containing protein [Nocardioidaceae bacterium]